MNRAFTMRIYILLLFSFLQLYNTVSYAEEISISPDAESDANIDINDSLRAAIINSDAEQVKILIEKGAAVNKVYDDELTPLLEAIARSNGSTEIVKLLLELGADPRLKTKNFSSLTSALNTNNEALIKFFIPFAADDKDFFGLATYYWNKRDGDSALAYCDKALTINPYNYLVWELKGSIYYSQKNIKNAEMAYKKAFETSAENLKINKTTDNFINTTWSAIVSANFMDALRIAKEGSALFPESTEITMNKGHALMLLGDKRESISTYRKICNEMIPDEERESCPARLFEQVFIQLKERYPDKVSQIEWVENKLREPFDFPYEEIPFDEEKDRVLNLVKGASSWQDETVTIGIQDPVLTKQFGAGILPIDHNTVLDPHVVQKYVVKYEKWDALEQVDLFFTSPSGRTGSALFVVSKSFKEQQGTIDAIFKTMQDTISKEIQIKPAVHSTQDVSSTGPAPVKLAVWDAQDRTVLLRVFSVSPLSKYVQSRIFYISKKGWEQYIHFLRRQQISK